ASGTLTGLVEDVLRTSNNEDADWRPEALRLGSLVGELRANFALTTQEKALRLELPHGSLENTWVLIDRTRPRRIFVNLLSNAIKFTPAGRVGLRLRLRQNRLCFLVYDDGIGMRPDDVRRAFEPLFRGTNASGGAFSGTGLGLSIARQLIDLEGGRVRIFSRLDQGTVVAGWVPVTVIDPPQGKAQPSDDRAPPAASLRVLAIEDEPLNMAVMRRMLTALGHQIVEARSGAEALALFKRFPFDCILSDIRMSDMTGVELLPELTRVAASAPSGEIPVFAVTANAFAEDIALYEDIGFDGVLSKPIDEAILARRLSEVALQKQAMQHLEEQTVSRPVSHAGDRVFEHLYADTATDCLEHLDSDDKATLERSAHRLHGAALYARDAKTARLAANLENALRQGGDNWGDARRTLALHLQSVTTALPHSLNEPGPDRS
ncbi:MAG: ATP-binding protein, partial [Pseudomonadota bacterium]